MDFKFSEYYSILTTKGLNDAIAYKNNSIPQKLYKFIPLYDDMADENKKRFSSLENNQTWLSSFKKLNDPFEFEAFIVNESRLKEYGWSGEGFAMIDKVLTSIKNSYYICCFSKSFNDNLPMWAYYANNHKGFCIEYTIHNPDEIYQVYYEQQRIETAVVISKFVNSFLNLVENHAEKPSQEFETYQEILKLSFVVKHHSWDHEGEYRLIIPINSKKDGGLVSNNDLGIMPSRIFAGMNCANIDRLNAIGSKINCDVYKMMVDNSSLDFDLQYQKI